MSHQLVIDLAGEEDEDEDEKLEKEGLAAIVVDDDSDDFEMRTDALSGSSSRHTTSTSEQGKRHRKSGSPGSYDEFTFDDVWGIIERERAAKRRKLQKLYVISLLNRFVGVACTYSLTTLSAGASYRIHPCTSSSL